MNVSTRFQAAAQAVRHEMPAFVYCPICTHTVEAIVMTQGKTTKVKPGQKCSRCSASLDPAIIVRMARAA